MSRLARIHLSLALLAILAGCQRILIPTPNLYAYSESDPFADVPPELATNTVDLLYVTDRQPEGGNGADERSVQYGYGRSFSVAVGSCVVEIGNGVSWKELVQASRAKKRGGTLPLHVRTVTEQFRFPPTPPPIVVTNGDVQETPRYIAAKQAAIGALHDELRRRLAVTPRKEAYVFVHGYANTFEKAAFRMAELWHFLGREGVPILYSWPAGYPGLLRGYTHDRESGEFTIFHLKEFFKALAACPELDTVHVIAHSRGTDVAMTALREIIIEARARGDDPQTVLKIGNVIMAAPDVDMEVAGQRFGAERLNDGWELLTVYVSKNDHAIGTAEWLFASPRRIGRLELKDITASERARTRLIPNADIVDARVRTDYKGHGYFLSNPAVFSDVILVLRYDRTPGAEHDRPLTEIFPGYYILDDRYPQHAAPLPKK